MRIEADELSELYELAHTDPALPGLESRHPILGQSHLLGEHSLRDAAPLALRLQELHQQAVAFGVNFFHIAAISHGQIILQNQILKQDLERANVFYLR